MINILIVSVNPETAAIYRMALEKRGYLCEVAEGINDMQQKMVRMPFNGLLLDIVTTVKASQKEKLFIQEICDLYPTLRVRWDSKARQIRGLMLGRSLQKEDLLKDFVDNFCSTQPARIFRAHSRFPIHFNVLLHREEALPEEEVEKTVTLDLSEKGCFLISRQSWQENEIAWIRLLELSDPSPIQVEIRRYFPWGEAMHIPGIGVEFKKLSPVQIKEIYLHLAPKL